MSKKPVSLSTNRIMVLVYATIGSNKAQLFRIIHIYFSYLHPHPPEKTALPSSLFLKEGDPPEHKPDTFKWTLRH